ncbi:hypothetical protein U1Q18_027053 [Sarracenia purpurea var. burkii]
MLIILGFAHYLINVAAIAACALGFLGVGSFGVRCLLCCGLDNLDWSLCAGLVWAGCDFAVGLVPMMEPVCWYCFWVGCSFDVADHVLESVFRSWIGYIWPGFAVLFDWGYAPCSKGVVLPASVLPADRLPAGFALALICLGLVLH